MTSNTKELQRRGIVRQRQEHVIRLCLENEISYSLKDSGSHASADPEARSVKIPFVTRTRSYYVALHEIAHVILGYDYDELAAPQESAAWQWAFQNAIEPPTKGIKPFVLEKIWNYMLSDADPSHHRYKPEVEPIAPPNDPMWSFIATLMTDPARELRKLAKLVAYSGMYGEFQGQKPTMTNAAIANRFGTPPGGDD